MKINIKKILKNTLLFILISVGILLFYFGTRSINQKVEKESIKNILPKLEENNKNITPSVKVIKKDEIAPQNEQNIPNKDQNKTETKNLPKDTNAKITEKHIEKQNKQSSIPKKIEQKQKEKLKKISQKQIKNKPIFKKPQEKFEKGIYLVGSFKKKQNAQNLVKELFKKHIYAFISYYNGFYRVLVRVETQNQLRAIPKAIKVQ